MPKVYIINKGAHDYSDAERYGELITCTEGMVDATDTGTMYRLFIDAFKHSHEDDYILVTSLNVLCSVACGIFGRKHGRLNLLIFRQGAYVARNIHLDNLLTRSTNDSSEASSALSSGG